MIIIWRGLGFLVLAVVLVCLFVGSLVFDAFKGDGYFETHHWTQALALIAAAAGCWTLGNQLQRWSVGRDKASGSDYDDNWPRHTLFFIPMHYWAPILLVVALYQVLAR